MIKPNFFIIGAPKCGTTSLINYLSQHKNVCISRPKEPHYFLTDLPKYRQVKSKEAYEKCFDSFKKEHVRIGEASTWYLFSKEAVGNILEYDADAKIVAMVRNPIELFESLYRQFLFGFEENASTIEEAWGLQDDRLKGRKIPKSCFEPVRLQYRDVCRLGAQLERVMGLVPKENLMIIEFDEFKHNTRKVYADVLTFLGLPGENKIDFPVHNKRKNHKSEKIAKFLITNPYFNKFVKITKRILNLKSIGLSSRILKLNVAESKRVKMKKKFHSELVDYFEVDMKKTETILGKNFPHWREY